MTLAACFTLRGHGTPIDLLWRSVSGQQDLPSDERAFSLTFNLKRTAFYRD